MIRHVKTSAPDVNPLQLLGTGVTQLRAVFTPEQLPGILDAYMIGIKTAFALAVGAIGGAFLVSLFGRFKRLNTEALKNGGGAV